MYKYVFILIKEESTFSPFSSSFSSKSKEKKKVNRYIDISMPIYVHIEAKKKNIF